ncbi:ABC transporter substrate-binding protein [Paenibacillus sp. HB172176]|uniref:ABC transporter substrate-binding protein n=1 Tax=Paenibacillus sp. HB172176 TaxID=2493690 RepID=UPI0014399547|nr:ABC transporter substrate-binding protein [Paenibacillus sp. HB172176]
MRKPTIAVISALLLISLLVSACRGDNNNESAISSAGTGNDKIVTLRMIMPGDESPRMREFVDNELNARLRHDLNMELDLTYIPWGSYQQKLELALSTGEKYDLFWYGTPFVSGYMTQGYIQPLDDLLEQYGRDLIANIPAENFKLDRINGKQWAIPSQAFTSAGKFTSMLVRQDLLESVGMREIRSIADLELFYKKVHERDPSYYGYLETDRGQDILWREIGGRNYTMLDERQLFAVDEDSGELMNYVESELYKKTVQLRESWVDKGIIDRDLVGNPAAKIDQENAGKLLFRVGAVSRAMENWQTAQKADPNARLREYYLSPGKPKYITAPSNEAYMIPSAAEHPELAMQFMNWILQSKENYMFIIYGVEGVDYELDDGEIKLLTNDQLMYEWMWRNTNYFTAPRIVDDEVIDDMLGNDDNARISKLFGFHFNEEPVKNELAKVMTVYKEKFEPINFGLVGYDEGYEDAIQSLKKAGLDIVFAEVKRQFEAFRAQTGDEDE